MRKINVFNVKMNFDIINLQTFDTVEVSNFDSNDNCKIKGFFLNYSGVVFDYYSDVIVSEEIKYRSRIKGFKHVVIFSNNKIFTLLAPLDIESSEFIEKHIKVFSTRMVLTEKLKFKDEI